MHLGASPALAHPGAGLVVGADGAIYFTFGPSHRIWAVSPDGDARIVAEGGLDQAFRVPHHLVLDAEGNLCTASDAGGLVFKVGPDGALKQVYPPEGQAPAFIIGAGGDPFTIDRQGRIIGIDAGPDGDHTIIRRIEADGRVTTLAGGPRGHTDGRGSAARFGDLHSACFAWGPDGPLYLTDDGTRVRIVSPDGDVTTLAGGGDGPAPFTSAMGLVVAPDGAVLVADAAARCIRHITPTGAATTLAGLGEAGGDDGPALRVRFDEPVGIALDREGRIVVLDVAPGRGGAVIHLRRIDESGTVSTIARIDEP